MSQVVFSPLAETDLFEILDYISHDKPRAAVEFVADLRKTCYMLGANPELGQRRPGFRTGELTAQHMRCTIVIFLLLVAADGCAPGVENREASAPADKPSAGASRAVRPSPPPPPPPPENVTASSSPSAAAPSPSPAATQTPPLQVDLSAGVALPQTGPTGILMSFSVDYRIVEGQPTPSLGYVWVIQRQEGPPAKEPVRLTDHGTLTALIPGWRPADGPFSGHLEDRNGSKLSRPIDLQ